MLNDCPTCGRAISYNARSCPHCGEPDPGRRWLTNFRLEQELEQERKKKGKLNSREARNVGIVGFVIGGGLLTGYLFSKSIPGQILDRIVLGFAIGGAIGCWIGHIIWIFIKPIVRWITK